ncbi:hypothetical protein DL767_007208 [Monosporascus sp. MG133]|nr:hypothetical protein DL767_007208 [Monosporascus sp. MG133]
MLLKNSRRGGITLATVYGDVVRYPRPSIYDKSAHFGLKVDGIDMYTVSYARYDYVQLSMDEGSPTEFRIRTLDKKLITSYTIAPQKLPMNARVEGDELMFSIKKAHYIIVKINDKKHSFWAVTPIQAEEATFTNLKILNRFDMTQDDGVDVVESTKDVFFDDCLAWTDCYGYKVGQDVWEDQDTVTFQNSVVYSAAGGMGIDHKFGTATASHITFRNMDIEGLHERVSKDRALGGSRAMTRLRWSSYYVQFKSACGGPPLKAAGSLMTPKPESTGLERDQIALNKARSTKQAKAASKLSVFLRRRRDYSVAKPVPT